MSPFCDPIVELEQVSIAIKVARPIKSLFADAIYV